MDLWLSTGGNHDEQSDPDGDIAIAWEMHTILSCATPLGIDSTCGATVAMSEMTFQYASQSDQSSQPEPLSMSK